jgi:hypothetical protein
MGVGFRAVQDRVVVKRVDEVVAKAPFRISIEKELTPEELDN